jgi:hypothetical protein
MHTGKYYKLIAASALLSLGSVFAHAGDNHWDLPSCYIDVHNGCFNKGTKCSREDYDGFLQECDDNYSKAVAIPKPAYSSRLSGHMMKYVGRSR